MIVVRRDGSRRFSTRSEADRAAGAVREAVKAAHPWTGWERREPDKWIGKDGVATWVVRVEEDGGLWGVQVCLASDDARTICGLYIPSNGTVAEVVAEADRRRQADADVGLMWEDDAELGA